MPGIRLQTDAFILRRQPSASDGYEQLSAFSAEQGTLLVLRRLSSTKAASSNVSVDLFDEVHLDLESSNQGRTWFLKDAQLITRSGGIGRSYETLAAASRLATLIARNTVHEESREPVASLLRQAFSSFGSAASPHAVFFKSLYCFARDEGYPVRQDWWQNLPPAARAEAAKLLNTPLAELPKETSEEAKN